MQDFRELMVWQKSHQLTLDVYSVTNAFPSSELYGLTGQLRRAAISISTNIAEGSGRETRPDFIRFLNIASGSASEVDYLLQLAHDLDYIDLNNHQRLTSQVKEVHKMLAGLIKKLKTFNS